jgi:hypothetical protein
MDKAHEAWTIVRLWHDLQALAMPAEIQLSLFPDFVCKGDELALGFGHSYDVARDNYPDYFTPNQWTTLETIEHVLDQMSGQENADRWTDDAVRVSGDWGLLRTLAQIALGAIGWKVEIPPSYAHEYIPGSASDRPSENS